MTISRSKVFFLGPQSENSDWFTEKVNQVLHHIFKWRESLFPDDGTAITLADTKNSEFLNLQHNMSVALAHLLRRLEGETPKFTPRYIGHMVSEISLPALLGEFAMLMHNPNNASREAAKVGLQIEAEAINMLAQMVGFHPEAARGHFTSCGTVANFEAVWRMLSRFDENFSVALSLIKTGVARQEDFFKLCHQTAVERQELRKKYPAELSAEKNYSILRTGPWNNPVASILKTPFLGPVILVPGNKHYSWPKATSVFGLGLANFWPIQLDENGRLDVHDLEMQIQKAQKENRPVLGIVSVAGTTELGEIDPINEVQLVLSKWKQQGIHLWHHVDGAYGGFFPCLNLDSHSGLSEKTISSLAGICNVDSITIDPHKLGYIPYACGAFITRDSNHYSNFQVDAPYLKMSDLKTPGWSTTLEGSRSAAGAAAVWLTGQTLTYNKTGFGRILKKTIEARKEFSEKLLTVSPIKQITPCDTNVLCFSVAQKSRPLPEINKITQELFARIDQGADFSVSRTTLTRAGYSKMIARLCAEWEIADDQRSDLVVIRLVLMNPFIVTKEAKINFADEFIRVATKELAAIK